MKYRQNELYHEQSLDDTGTLIRDLNFKDPLSALGLQFVGTNGDTSNKGNWMSDVVTKVELVDGSDVLTSLSLKQGQAFQGNQTKQTPYINFEEGPDGTGKDEVMLHYGRQLWDPEYYLDLTKFSNPQLKITTDEDVIRAMGSDGFLTGSFKVSITAFIIQEGAPAAKGFIMAKEHYSFTSADSGDEHVPLPRDYPYLSLMLNSTIRGSDCHELITQMKISCDSDKFVPLDQYTKHYQEQHENQLPPFQMRALFFRKNAETVNFPIYYNPRFNALPSALGSSINTGWIWSGNMNFQLADGSGDPVTSEEVIKAHILGGSLQNSIYVPFGILEDPDSYFAAGDWNEVDLILTQDNAGAVKVCLQQLRSYA